MATASRVLVSTGRTLARALSEYGEYDALGLAELVRRREVTPGELAGAALRAIELLNPTLNAVIEVYGDRIQSADVAHTAEGPFLGVPFLIKDDGDFEVGRTFEQGSRLLKGRIGANDAFFIQLVRASGLNSIGRTNVPEFCIANTTENVLYGNTSNPWRSGYSAGGSSGGAAAAVVSGIVPLAHGSGPLAIVDALGSSLRVDGSLLGHTPTRARGECRRSWSRVAR
jgi:amidase